MRCPRFENTSISGHLQQSMSSELRCLEGEKLLDLGVCLQMGVVCFWLPFKTQLPSGFPFFGEGFRFLESQPTNQGMPLPFPTEKSTGHLRKANQTRGFLSKIDKPDPFGRRLPMPPAPRSFGTAPAAGGWRQGLELESGGCFSKVGFNSSTNANSFRLVSFWFPFNTHPKKCPFFETPTRKRA